MAEYRYRCTVVTTEDYGDSPHAGQTAIATLAVISDGSHWQDRPATIKLRVPCGTRPGGTWLVTITEADNG